MRLSGDNRDFFFFFRILSHASVVSKPTKPSSEIMDNFASHDGGEVVWPEKNQAEDFLNTSRSIVVCGNDASRGNARTLLAAAFDVDSQCGRSCCQRNDDEQQYS